MSLYYINMCINCKIQALSRRFYGTNNLTKLTVVSKINIRQLIFIYVFINFFLYERTEFQISLNSFISYA